MSNIRFIEVSQDHELYDTLQKLLNDEGLAEDDLVSDSYPVNTPISTIRCFWQHLVSSTVGAGLVYIKVLCENGNEVRDEVVQNRHRDGRSVTIEDLAKLASPNWRNDPSFVLRLTFEYVKNTPAVLPDCICNF